MCISNFNLVKLDFQPNQTLSQDDCALGDSDALFLRRLTDCLQSVDGLASPSYSGVSRSLISTVASSAWTVNMREYTVENSQYLMLFRIREKHKVVGSSKLASLVRHVLTSFLSQRALSEAQLGSF